MGVAGSIPLSKFKGIKWETIYQTFYVSVICPSYLIIEIVWILLYIMLFSPTCCLYKWKVSIHLSLPFVLFSSCSPFLKLGHEWGSCGLNDAVGDISFTLLFHSVALTEPGEEHGEVAQVGLEQFLSWKHGFAKLSGEKKSQCFCIN